jgi:hypothetical protein
MNYVTFRQLSIIWYLKNELPTYKKTYKKHNCLLLSERSQLKTKKFTVYSQQYDIVDKKKLLRLIGVYQELKGREQ